MFKNRIIQLTDDGSHTIAVPEQNVTYHSKYGAIQESMHIFINAGLRHLLDTTCAPEQEEINIFEMGFGTGLNALLSLNEAIRFNQKIFYQAIELYPLSNEEAQQLNYASLTNKNLQESFLQLHQCEWNKEISIHPLFSFQKINIALREFETGKKFRLIYFDAFDPNAQPGLWTEFIFGKMFRFLYNKGILVTYCSKGTVQRAMQAAGFNVEKLPGPPGKREMLRATRSVRNEL